VQAWAQFVERFSQLIFWAIRHRLKSANYRYNQQDIEDIFQDVFVLLWEKDKLRQIKNRENPSGWLAMVAANCTHNFFRNKREAWVRTEALPEDIASSDCATAGFINQEKLNSILEEAFNLLPARETIILKLCYLYDKTHQEIGEILKMPVNTVSSIIKRTRERLKEKLETEGVKDF